MVLKISGFVTGMVWSELSCLSSTLDKEQALQSVAEMRYFRFPVLSLPQYCCVLHPGEQLDNSFFFFFWSHITSISFSNNFFPWLLLILVVDKPYLKPVVDNFHGFPSAHGHTSLKAAMFLCDPRLPKPGQRWMDQTWMRDPSSS